MDFHIKHTLFSKLFCDIKFLFLKNKMLNPNQLSVEGTRSAYGRALNTMGESPHSDHVTLSLPGRDSLSFPFKFPWELKVRSWAVSMKRAFSLQEVESEIHGNKEF